MSRLFKVDSLYVLGLNKMKITWNAGFCAPQNDGPLNNWARLIAS